MMKKINTNIQPYVQTKNQQNVLKISFVEFSRIVGGQILKNDLNFDVEIINIDSRKLKVLDNSIFLALKGKNFDSHELIETIYSQGVRQFIIENDINTNFFLNKKVNIVKVKNSIDAFHNYASYKRNKIQIPIIGITGSNAKTIIKEWLSTSLSKIHNLIKSPKSYNSQIGVPLSIYKINESHEFGIFEAGISKKNEMQKLFKVINPTIGIFTNLGSAHESGFNSIYEKALEKSYLFKNCKKIFYCKDHHVIHNVLTERYEKHKLISWKLEKNLLNKKHLKSQLHNLYYENEYLVYYQTEDHFNTIYLSDKNNENVLSFKTIFKNKIYIENLIHCIIVLLHELKNYELINDHIKNFFPLDMRLILKEGINNCQIIDDAYINEYDSLKVALDFMDEQVKIFNKQDLSQNLPKEKIVIISDFSEAKNYDTLYSRVFELFKTYNIKKVIAIGDMFYKKKHFFESLNILFYKDVPNFLESKDNHFQDNIILVKGSRKFKLEKIISKLEYKKHATNLEINFNAIIHNLNFFKSQLKKDTKLMIMVKAFSYGSSDFEIPKLLEFHNIDYLSVAYVDEGINLRKNGINLPILVLHPTENCFDVLLEYNLEPEIYSIEFLNKYLKYANHKLIHNQLPIHLKIDSGMHRLGIQKSEINTLLEILIKNPNLKIKSIFSHLAATESSNFDDYTFKQAKIFETIYDKISHVLNYRPIKHLLNTSGILRFPQFHFDLVRLGIGLYGVGVPKIWNKNLIPSCTLYSCILQIKNLPKNSTVGYKREYILKKDSKIAIIAIGYADGLHRILENSEVLIKNKPAKILHICMDVSIIDITNIENINLGDRVIIFDEHYSLNTLSNKDLKPHQILTQISKRVGRKYIKE